MTKEFLISPSKLTTFEGCPMQYKFKYIDKLPALDHDYFDFGHNVEEIVQTRLSGDYPGSYNKKWILFTPEERKLAFAIHEHKPFQELIKGRKLKFQYEFKEGGYHGITDIETDDDLPNQFIIDIKTSKASWDNEKVKEMRMQPKIYTLIRKKEFYFLVGNKTNYTVQMIKTPIKDYTDLKEKCIELKTSIEMGMFPKNPSWKCKVLCDFNQVCRWLN